MIEGETAEGKITVISIFEMEAVLKQFEAFFRKEDGHAIEAHGAPVDFEKISENNLFAKAAMVTELVEMGFTLEAIERILKLDSATLDRFL